MEFIAKNTITTLSNSGVDSQQLLFPENSTSERLTITRVTMLPGVLNPRHAHPTSEQIWLALEGHGELLLANDQTQVFSAGDVVRFVDGDIHGFHNTGEQPFVYISVTSPPINFRKAYAENWQPDIAQDRA